MHTTIDEVEAEWLLCTEDSVTYDAFRANFLANFGHIYSVTDVLEMMCKTVYVPAKDTVMGYILKMQELASRADIDEVQTIRHVIDGLRDQSVNVALLYSATTLPALKQLTPRYVHLCETNSVVSSVRAGSDAKPKAAVGRTEATASTSAKAAARCYNCSGVGQCWPTIRSRSERSAHASDVDPRAT